MFMTCYSQKSFVVVCFVVFLWLFVLNSGVYEMLLRKKKKKMLCGQNADVNR